MHAFVCGTRKVIERKPKEFVVVCATCSNGGTVYHVNRESALRACTRDSSKPCRACGAS